MIYSNPRKWSLIDTVIVIDILLLAIGVILLRVGIIK